MFEQQMQVVETLFGEIAARAREAPDNYSGCRFMLRRAEAKLVEAFGFLEAAEDYYKIEKRRKEIELAKAGNAPSAVVPVPVKAKKTAARRRRKK